MQNPPAEPMELRGFFFALCLSILVLPARMFSQSDSTDLTRPRLRGYPYVFYSPETRLAFGGAFIVTFRTAPDSAIHPSSLALNAYYSVNRQYNISLAPEFFLNGNRQWYTATLEFGRFVDKFWGMGQDAPSTELIEFTKKIARILLRAQTAVFDRAKAGLILEADQTTIDDREASVRLESGGFTAPGGARSTGIGAGLTWDTRDRVYYPGHGGLYQVETTFFLEFLGSEHPFTRTTIDFRRYVTIGGPHIVAFQFYGAVVSGTPPFFKLPALGGENLMRGYYQGRYRDLLFVTAQAEYRVTLYRRLGMVVFAGAGDVGSALSSFTLRTLKPSVGLGLRFALEPEDRLNVRVDWGFGRDTDGLYFSLREAF